MDKTIKKEKKTDEKIDTRPPNGGWGVMVVLGYIIAGMTSIPIIQNFGLVYKGRLQDLGITSTQLTTIIALNSSIGQITGIMGGPLLKWFGCRKVAAVAVFLLSLGSLLTSLSQSFAHFILTHGLITSIGFTYTMTAFSMSLSSYFTTKRSRASGVLMGFTGIGPVVMPLLVTFSLEKYGVFGTGMLLAALNLHGLIGASFLKPFPPDNPTAQAYKALRKNPLAPIFAFLSRMKPKSRKHDVKLQQIISNSSLPTKKKYVQSLSESDKNPIEDEVSQQLPNIDAESLFGVEPMGGFDRSRRRSSGVTSNKRVRSVSENETSDEIFELATPVPQSYQSLQLKGTNADAHYRPDQKLHLTTDEPILNKENWSVPASGKWASTETLDSIRVYHPNEETKEDVESIKEKECFPINWKCIHSQFDLDLLQDPIFISITLGMSIAIIGELIFSLLTPFILNEIGLDLQQTAYFMSSVAVADIISRFLSPYLGEWVHLPSRAMYSLALGFLLFSRAALLLANNTASIIAVSIIIGAAKGVRTVYWGQVLPDHVPREKLGSAMSIQNLFNGILIFFAGPLAGMIVEINNSYLNIIYVSNALTGVTVLLWTVECLIVRFKSRSK